MPAMTMPEVIAKLFRRAGPLIAPERDLLESIRPQVIPDPDVLRAQMATVAQALAAAEREWVLLEQRPDAAAFLQRQPAAERVQALRAQLAQVSAQIEPATTKRAAVLDLARAHDALAATVAARTQRLIDQPPPDATMRAEELARLYRESRLHQRLAAKLAHVSADRRFKPPVDALGVLKDTHLTRIAEIDRVRSPGQRQPVEWPDTLRALLAVLDDTEGRTA
jgi:hypothetical protein